MLGETFANTTRRNPARVHVYQPSEMTKHTYQYPKVTPVAPPAASALQSGAGSPPAQGSGSGRRSS